MPLPPQNLQRQLFYFEGALVRHLGSPRRSVSLKPPARADTIETNPLTDASISFKANPIWFRDYLRGLIFSSSHLVTPSRGAM